MFQGELVWFDPGVGHALPGEVLEYHKPAQVLTVQAVIAGKVSSLDFRQSTLSEIVQFGFSSMKTIEMFKLPYIPCSTKT